MPQRRLCALCILRTPNARLYRASDRAPSRPSALRLSAAELVPALVSLTRHSCLTRTRARSAQGVPSVICERSAVARSAIDARARPVTAWHATLDELELSAIVDGAAGRGGRRGRGLGAGPYRSVVRRAVGDEHGNATALTTSGLGRGLRREEGRRGSATRTAWRARSPLRADARAGAGREARLTAKYPTWRYAASAEQRACAHRSPSCTRPCRGATSPTTAS